MKCPFPAFVVAMLTVGSVARADILPGLFPISGFSINQDDGGAIPDVQPNEIHLINHSSNESRSIFYNQPQGIGSFTASFKYRASGPQGDGRFGACFVLQKNGAGAHAVADPTDLGVLTKFGYFDEWGSLTPSVGVSLEYGSLSAGSSSTAAYKNAGISGGSNLLPFDLFANHVIAAQITYDGTLLHETLTDTQTGVQFDRYYPIDIPGTVGSSTAYVGFTAASASSSTADQYFSDFVYYAPEPASVAFLLLGVAAVRARRQRPVM